MFQHPRTSRPLTTSSADLLPGEPHPAAHSALAYVRGIPSAELMVIQEGFASTALSGSRSSQICLETLQRVMDGRPVSDRYVLGLAWALREIRK